VGRLRAECGVVRGDYEETEGRRSEGLAEVLFAETERILRGG
jgi:hypothetical protein